jgi:hypothetical protein
MRTLLPLWFFACSAPPEPVGGPPRLQLPVDCTLGDTCWWINRPDVAPDAAVYDHGGRDHTWDGNDGSDLALAHLGAAASFHARATADGVVKEVVEDAVDGVALTAGRGAVAADPCGNRVVIDHGGGWLTTTCHLGWRSVTVEPGAAVRAGDPLGAVGWSGLAELAHLRLIVSHDGVAVDPFTGRPHTQAPDVHADPPAPLWTEPAPMPGETLPLAVVGFAPAPWSEAWSYGAGTPVLPQEAASTGFVMFAVLWRPEAGDVIRSILRGPDGAEQTASHKITKAQLRKVVLVPQLREGASAWTGVWTAEISVDRAGRTQTRRAVLAVPPDGWQGPSGGDADRAPKTP